jgi:ABC-type multidrug transport system fused ATPase/permease subunit
MPILSKSDRFKLGFFVLGQFLLSLLDVLAVALIGLLITLATSRTSSSPQSGLKQEILSSTPIAGYSSQSQILILGVSASLILLVKMISVLSLLRKLNDFLSVRGAEISGKLTLKLLSTSLIKLQVRTMQESLWLLTHGVSTLMLGIVARCVTMFGDIAMIIVMFLMLFLVNPSIAFSAVLIFGVISVTLYFILRKRALLTGEMHWTLEVKSNQEIYEVLSSFRETFVKNRQYFYANRIKNTRLELANVMATLNFLPNISKYILETAVTLGALAVAAVQFSISDFETAITALGLFLGASTRIAPAILRLQQNSIDFKAAMGTVRPVLVLMRELQDISPVLPTADEVNTDYVGFNANISVKGASFTYPKNESPALINVSIEIEQGKSYAVVGPSGAGKSTLIDMILGIISPDTGSVLISGVSPQGAIKTWPGSIAYVPQEVVVINGTLKDNIILGFPGQLESEKMIESAIKLSQLTDFIKGLPKGLDTNLGDRGSKLSGGQKQRLGIARALYTKPLLLVLDEATSALDGQTEEDISSAILGTLNITVITIAHRASTILKADSLIYIENGNVVAMGTLSDVRMRVPEFDMQMKLMRL